MINNKKFVFMIFFVLFCFIVCVFNEESISIKERKKMDKSVMFLFNFIFVMFDFYMDDNYIVVCVGVGEMFVKISNDLKIKFWFVEKWKMEDNGFMWIFMIRKNIMF